MPDTRRVQDLEFALRIAHAREERLAEAIRVKDEALVVAAGLLEEAIDGFAGHKQWCWKLVAQILAEPGQATPRAICDCGFDALAERRNAVAA